MHEKTHLRGSRSNPASRFKRPMDVVEAVGMGKTEHPQILGGG
jgi:hypothetical protein